ncbi:putative bifunctional diguanylate cyclase/phosphodiesterase [Thioalkalivibrio thiocyanodenitrificans]|uniref:putative bifunctional diguanylate cyclase/phosphodiesterase n=1 Tax=Thioalkalivibrio thiocyanodenitrificans TaxID=243063 RepID=UPI0009FEC1DE|nr:EAL domain-containing protein [Thioalkalivibrio thiocyanodenitrificans]
MSSARSIPGQVGTHLINDPDSRDPPDTRAAPAGAFSPDTVIQAAFLAGDHPVLLVDARSRTILACNAATERVFGYPSYDLLGKSTRILHVSDAHYEEFGRESERVLHNVPGSYHSHFWLRRRDGSTFPSEHLVQVVDDRAGEPRAVISIVRDVSESVHAEPPPHPGKAGFHSLARHLPGIVFQHVRTRDGAARNSYLSGNLFENYGIDPDAMQADPRHFFDAIHPEDRPRLGHAMDRSAETLTGIDIRVRLRIPDDGHVWLHIMAQPHRLDDGAVVWDGLALDVTREVQAEERLHHLATHDALTGLPNQFQFLSLLDQMMARAGIGNRRIAVALANLGRMVYINETYGFEAGDELLRQAGARLLEHLRPEDLTGRGHGNTFLLALEVDVDDAELSGTLRRIQEAFAQPFTVMSGVPIRMDTRIGLALFPTDGSTGEGLLRASGIALDRAKRHPDRNYEFYAEEQGRELRRRIRQEQALDNAIKAGEFVPWYQPQVSLVDGSLIGLEALARRPGPSGELTAPAQFIQLAEETGLIIPLGELILDRVLAQIREWTGTGLKVPPVSINVSARQFRQAGFESGLRERLAGTGVDPGALVVELTESSLLENYSAAQQTMRALTELGVHFSIDDFGTGFSSLGYLAELPFHILKIDRSFSSTIGQDARRRAIIESLILMSRGLDLLVVAEGVETEEQARLLREMGCHAAQGYFYAPALPADRLTVWLRDSQ